MRKTFAILLILVMLLTLVACNDNKSDSASGNKGVISKDDEIVKDALEELKDHWEDAFEDADIETDGHFEVKNTRVITLKENDIEMFAGIEKLIEFDIYTDYFGSAPYYIDTTLNNMVAVYDDGSMKVKQNLISQYRSRYYDNSVTAFVDSVEDCGDQYNCVEKFK